MSNRVCQLELYNSLLSSILNVIGDSFKLVKRYLNFLFDWCTFTTFLRIRETVADQ
jgi:hypothetical protein